MLHERYGEGFFRRNFRGHSPEVLEDLEQEIWSQLVGSNFVPYGSLYSTLLRIAQQRIGQVIDGKSSVKSLNFADVEIDGQSIEESGRLHPLQDNDKL